MTLRGLPFSEKYAKLNVPNINDSFAWVIRLSCKQPLMVWFLLFVVNPGNGNGKKELQSLASNLNKKKKAFLESLHNLKNLPECCNKMQTTFVPSGHCGADNEESTAMTLRSVPSKLSPGHFISSQSQSRQPETDGEQQDYLNNFPWASCLVNEIQRTHLCLNCFPKLEAREEFQFFVENLFIANVGSNDH